MLPPVCRCHLAAHAPRTRLAHTVLRDKALRCAALRCWESGCLPVCSPLPCVHRRRLPCAPVNHVAELLCKCLPLCAGRSAQAEARGCQGDAEVPLRPHGRAQGVRAAHRTGRHSPSVLPGLRPEQGRVGLPLHAMGCVKGPEHSARATCARVVPAGALHQPVHFAYHDASADVSGQTQTELGRNRHLPHI